MRVRRNRGERGRPALRGAAAGAAAACAWVAVEPLAERALRTGYTDVRLLGRMISERAWVPAGIAAHTFNGAVFGAVFALAGGRGPRAGLAWGAAEMIASWPAMALVDRVHPDRRSGRWGPLLTDRRVFAQETAVHLMFGALLGLLMTDEG
jgi:hypothetical protein